MLDDKELIVDKVVLINKKPYVGLSTTGLHEEDHSDLTSIREHVLKDKDEVIFVLTQHAHALQEV